jgi:hypothetical protein
MCQSAVPYERSGAAPSTMVLARQQHDAVGESMSRLLRLMTHLTAQEMHSRVAFLRAWGVTRGAQAP